MGKAYFKVITNPEDTSKEVTICIRLMEGKIDQATRTRKNVNFNFGIQEEHAEMLKKPGEKQSINLL